MKHRRIPIQIWLVLLAFSTSIAFPQPVTGIAAGSGHSLFLKSGGSLWAMGGDSHGQLGDGNSGVNYDIYETNVPEQIVASNVVAIAGGGLHSLFLRSDGSLWAVGYNVVGELGDGTYNQTNQPELIVASNVTAISAGYANSMFIKSNGSLWAMGWNRRGELGDGTYNNTNRPETRRTPPRTISGVSAPCLEVASGIPA
jgi:alpha-tubulin suppressor-like RCC1 family protein